MVIGSSKCTPKPKRPPSTVGDAVGSEVVGYGVGVSVGLGEGWRLGRGNGNAVGIGAGADVGAGTRLPVGEGTGNSLGELLGKSDGAAVGVLVGAGDGLWVSTVSPSTLTLAMDRRRPAEDDAYACIRVSNSPDETADVSDAVA